MVVRYVYLDSNLNSKIERKYYYLKNGRRQKDNEAQVHIHET